MGAVVEIVVPVFALVLCGWGFARWGLLPAGGARALGVFVFNLAIPALLFRAMAQGLPDLGDAWGLIAAYFGGCAAVFLAAELLGRRPFAISAAERAVMGMSGGFSNVVVIGLPLIALAYGPAGLVPAVLIIAFHSPVLITATTLLVEAAQGRGEGSLRVAAATLGSLLHNPIVVGLLAGAAWGAAGLAMPAPMGRFLDLLAAAAPPAALFALGASLVDFRIRGALRESAATVAIKLALHPLLVWLLAVFVFRLPPLWTDIAVLCAALPTGANVFLLAQRHGVYLQRSATVVLVSTALSIASLSLILTLAPPP
ncbi:MAG: AEC family transporter [Alphaproteobacteria bacterium]